MDEAVFHIDVIFSGRVQGVGFRYQALHVAKGFEVAGYVRNLSDGRVRMEAEGAQGEVEAFREAVEQQMEGYIKHSEVRSGQRPGRFRGFTIAQ